MRFRLEIRDRNFVTKEILDDEYLDLNWSYAAIGGCGEFSFTLPRKRFGEKAITGESNVRIYYRDELTSSHVLWYQGLIENKTPSVRGNSENIYFSGHGYQAQLSRIKFTSETTYSSQEASVIIKSLLDNYITSSTDISYTVGDLQATTFTFDTLTFNIGESLLSAIEKIANTVGSIEWGVNASRMFYFKARSTSIGYRFLSGVNISNFNDTQDFTQIINKVIIQGAQNAGTYYTFGPYQDLASQSKYGIRAQIKQNSSITTSAVASQFADAILDEFKEVTRKASCELVNYSAQIEATTPIPLASEISKKEKYGQKKYGTFLYSGLVGRSINRINYRYSNNGSLSVSLDLGPIRSTLADQISQLEYQLEEQRSASL